MPRSFLDFKILTQIRNSSLASLNSGSHLLDVRKRYACGHVSMAVMKYIETSDESALKVKYDFKPLSFNSAVEQCKSELERKDIKVLQNTSLAMVQMLLQSMGSGSYSMVSADFDTSKKTGRFMGGFKKFWGHWFNLVVIGGKVFPVDAYSEHTLFEGRFSENYLDQYKNDNVDAIIVPVRKRQAMYFE